MRTYHIDGSTPEDLVFVFGSNLAGHHYGGAARFAHQSRGAEWSRAEGLTGRSYAIPTVDLGMQPLSLDEIRAGVNRFIAHSAASDSLFFITRIGCGIAGHRNEDIAPMFKDAPDNCSLPDTWREILEALPA